MARRWLAPMLLTFAALGVGSVGPAPLRIIDEACAASATTAGEHRAVVIVDTGTQVRRVCVRFDEDAITGREALVRAGVNPVFKEYGGKGAFVCKLLDTGCPADDCQCDPDRYWVYSRAKAGSSSFTTSSLGVSSTAVRDGDVEGWRWSSGGAPAYVSPDTVCGPKTTTTVAPSAVSSGAGGGAGTSPPSGTGGGTGAAPSSSPRAVTAGGTTTAPGASGASTTDTSTTTGPASVADDQAAGDGGGERGIDSGSRQAASSTGEREGGTVAGALAFALVLIAIVAAWLLARRRRQAVAP